MGVEAGRRATRMERVAARLGVTVEQLRVAVLEESDTDCRCGVVSLSVRVPTDYGDA